MARKHNRTSLRPNPLGWMTTYSDLVTLLFTFFVLLMSMATLDKSVVNKSLSHFQDDTSTSFDKGSINAQSRHKQAAEFFQRPVKMVNNEKKVMDLLFPKGTLLTGMDRSMLDQNLEIVERPEGVALVLSDNLLFASGSWQINDDARPILREIAMLIAAMSAPVNISGYTDSKPFGLMTNYELSGRRALSVLDFFLTQNLQNERFSISGYGPSYPLVTENNDLDRAKNRRVEILIKTGPGAQTYL